MQIKTFEFYCFGSGVILTGELTKDIFLPKTGDLFRYNKQVYKVTQRDIDWDKQFLTIYVVEQF